MKNKLFIILLGFAALWLTACTEDDFAYEQSAASNEVKISATISPFPSTRAQIQTDGTGSFSIGDVIQLYTQGENGGSPSKRTMTLEEGGWAPRLTWDELGQTRTTFTAYSAFLQKDDRTGKRVHRVNYDQNNANSYAASDLLFATTTVNPKEAVQLNFKHAMSRLKVVLKSNYLTEADLKKARLSVWGFNQVEVDPMTGQTGMTKFYGNSDKRIQMRNMEGATFCAVMCPQEIADEWRDKWWLGIEVDGKYKEILAPKVLSDGTPFDRFEPGKEVTLIINLNQDKEIWAGQTHWVYGVKNPPIEDKSKWGYAYVDATQKILGLTWDRSYGWYDCNKKDPSAPTYDDNNMCWAATSSNMLHWWLEQNQGYINRWGQYTGPREYKNSFESEIFDLYKKNFVNEGFYIHRGLNWFFNGQMGVDSKKGAAFFKEVFGTSTMVRVSSYAGKRDRCDVEFSDDLKRAFRDKEAIGVSFILPIGGAHAITLWGADFDENGIVRALYLTENNDRGWEETKVECRPDLDRCIIPTGLFRKPIVYRDGKVYMESSSAGAFTMDINELCFLGLHQEEWQAYLKGIGK